MFSRSNTHSQHRRVMEDQTRNHSLLYGGEDSENIHTISAALSKHRYSAFDRSYQRNNNSLVIGQRTGAEREVFVTDVHSKN